MIFGLVLLVGGGRTFVTSAVEVADGLGIDETIVGLTVVAAGTSLPELATSILATIRGHRDIAVGNVVGSNLFNLTGVLGVTGLAGSGGLPVPPEVVRFDLPVMIATAFVCLPTMFSGRRLDRREGTVLVVSYLAYVTYLVLAAKEHAALRTFGRAMVWFVLPLSAITIAVIAYRELRADETRHS